MRGPGAARKGSPIYDAGMGARRILLVLTAVVMVAVAAGPAAARRRPPIVVAVYEGDHAKLTRLLAKAKPTDLDAFDREPSSPTAGMRAIEVAAERGDLVAAQALLAAGAQPTTGAVELAAAGGFVDLTMRLVEGGAPRAEQALAAAAKVGHAELVELLLPHARQADPSFNLDQILEFAVRFPPTPSAAVVTILLREKANPAIAWGPDQQTPLHLAVRRGASHVALVLLDAGAPIDAVDRDGDTPLHLVVRLDPAQGKVILDRMLAAKVPVDLPGKDGVTALMTAAGAGSLPWVELLLARGARPDARTTDGRVALDIALTCATSGGTQAPPTTCHGDVALRLLAGRDPPRGTIDQRGRTPLVRALLSGHQALAARLLMLTITTRSGRE